MKAKERKEKNKRRKEKRVPILQPTYLGLVTGHAPHNNRTALRSPSSHRQWRDQQQNIFIQKRIRRRTRVHFFTVSHDNPFFSVSIFIFQGRQRPLRTYTTITTTAVVPHHRCGSPPPNGVGVGKEVYRPVGHSRRAHGIKKFMEFGLARRLTDGCLGNK